MNAISKWISLTLLFGPLSSAYAMTPLEQVQADWAKCRYQTPSVDQQVNCYEQTIAETQLALTRDSNNPELKVWLAINQSSLASLSSGLGALSLVKEAKSLLEQVIAQAPNTLEGSAFTSLGILYYKVPGWPLSFGDTDQAEQLLKQALAINPIGIDANYFYGDFLIQQGREVEAKRYLQQAQQAPARPNRAVADAGRQQEIAQLLASLK
ncbi:tetratricopeptide repeat protein (plasmid) [Vibrio sp. HDW18]|uniref:tetratricopeptide repeat protein n=1 Tax=Vibrio sp. HDW18 TaxID=2714948 RepID=UPI00140CD733|nr:tetratricopeptide repeat protein [Vibrio sp. HDW18]QIL86756.1 tetratricopeptide repeat protein [Vibrio sp. HDW18]